MTSKSVSVKGGLKRTQSSERIALGEEIIQSVKVAVIAVDEQQRIVLFNPAAELIFRVSAEEVMGQSLERFIPQRAKAAHRQHLAAYAERHDGVRTMGADRLVSGVRADGEEFPLDATISQVEYAGGRRYVAVLRDVTERVHMQNELRASLDRQKHTEAELRESRDSLRELSAALQSIREEEKIRIARELHDELGQALTVLKMEASAIAGELSPEQADLARRAQGMKQLIDQTVASVRRISADLRPVMLDNLGLAPTLEWLTREMAGRAGIPIELILPNEDLGVSGDAATAIFRIVQEALTNVVRHAEARKVRVEIVRTGGDVRVRVSDDGRGMREFNQRNPRSPRNPRSFGLLGMRERATVLGGTFAITGADGKGTTVEVTIPAFGTVRGGAS